jgi:hypothetical protein
MNVVLPIIDLPEAETSFLKDLVKASRQRPHQVAWTDRDGTERHTALTPVEVMRLNQIAQRLKVSKAEVLRQATHIPVVRAGAKIEE